MSSWVWLQREVVIAVHEMQLAEHGGLAGVRDTGLLDSALARGPNTAAYGEPDVAALAAAFGWRLCRNHPFIDGNKRTGFVATELFLQLNGWQLQASDADCVLTMLAVASSDITEDAFTAWLRANTAPRP